MSKKKYQHWADEEYKKYLEDPDKIEFSLFDTDPPEVKEARSAGRRDGWHLQKQKENYESTKEKKRETISSESNSYSSYESSDSSKYVRSEKGQILDSIFFAIAFTCFFIWFTSFDYFENDQSNRVLFWKENLDYNFARAIQISSFVFMLIFSIILWIRNSKK